MPRKNKQALILQGHDPKYQRQYGKRKRDSNLYQNARFVKFGSELSIISLLTALNKTVDTFNKSYQHELHPRHALIMIFIKHYLTDTEKDIFLPSEILSYYPHLPMLLGFFANNEKTFKTLFNDLQHSHFLNFAGKHYNPTNRLKLFVGLFDNNAKELLPFSIDELKKD